MNISTLATGRIALQRDRDEHDLRGRLLASRLERLLERRELQRASWVQRAQTWEDGRSAELGPVEFPRDARVVIGLGVPCVDCLVLVYEQDQEGGELGRPELADGAVPAGPARHHVSFGILPGRHWAEFVAARCYR